MKPDRTFYIECYRRILGREPENEAVLDQLLLADRDMWDVIAMFTDSREFKERAARGSAHSLLKAFAPNCLSRDLSTTDRLRSLLTNYSALAEQLTDAALRRLFASGLPVLEPVPGNDRIRVDARLFQSSPVEGEVSLVASVHDRQVAVLTYTRVPADVVGLAGMDVLLISRVQGFIGVKVDAQDLAHRLGGISAPYLLLAALEGVASAQGIDRLVGVSGDLHPDYKTEDHQTFSAAYDDLFQSVGSRRLPSGLHLLTFPLEGRPLSELSRGHRARTRRKRATKRAIAAAAHEQWCAYVRGRRDEAQRDVRAWDTAVTI